MPAGPVVYVALPARRARLPLRMSKARAGLFYVAAPPRIRAPSVPLSDSPRAATTCVHSLARSAALAPPPRAALV